jgi:polyisoprenoid-binding protein YceI
MTVKTFAGRITLLTLSLIFFLNASSLEAKPKKLKLDKSHSQVEFSVRHLGISKISGEFTSFTTDVKWDDEDPIQSSIKAKIDVNSIDTSNKKRDKHLRSSDFFNTKEFPDITFESTSITPSDEEDEYTVTGKLTVKDVTKTVSFPLEIVGQVKGPRGRTRTAMEAELEINRFDYNVKWDNKLKDGSLIVSDIVEIEIATQFISK